MERGWAGLPDVALLEVLFRLDAVDRHAAAQVAEPWAAAVRDPRLWRFVKHDINAPTPVFQEAVGKYGRFMKRVELVWEKSLSSTEAPLANLNSLLSHKVQLTSLVLVDWVYNYKWPNRNKILLSLSKFLRVQERLQTLSLNNACMRQSEVLHLLASATYKSDKSLCVMELKSAFRDWQDPYAHPRYTGVIQSLIGLRKLAVDYHALSSHVIYQLASAKYLVSLDISVRAFDVRHPPIEDFAWAKLRQALPNLKVHIEIQNMAYHDELVYFLQPSIPLAGFHLYSGRLWNQSPTRNFRNTLEYLISNYSTSLRKVCIHVKNTMELLDDWLLELVKRCSSLEVFQYDGIIRNAEMITSLLHTLETFHPSRFKCIDIAPRYLNYSNRQTMYKIMKQYETKFVAQSVDFKIWEPSSVLLFY